MTTSSKISSKINSNIRKFSSYKSKNVIITTLIIIVILIAYLIITTCFVDNKKEPFDALNINNTYDTIYNPPENMRQVSSHYDTNHPNCKITNEFPRGKPEKGYYEDNKNNCYGPSNEYLSSMLDTPQGWSAFDNSAIDNNSVDKEWLQMDLGSIMTVSGVVTQSRGNGLPNAPGNYSDQMVSEYQVQWSTDKNKWENVDNSKKFTGNTVSNIKVRNLFSTPVLAQYIRILPTKYINWTSMRAAVLIPNSVTIKINTKPTLYPITNGSINVNNNYYSIYNPPENMRQVSSHYDTTHPNCLIKDTPPRGKPVRGYYVDSSEYCYGPAGDHLSSMLNTPQGWSTFNNTSIDNNLEKEWLEMNLGSVMSVAGVITQSRGKGLPGAGDASYQMVTEYQVQWRPNTTTNWEYAYNKSIGDTKFKGNTTSNKKEGNVFFTPVLAQYIRILPTQYLKNLEKDQVPMISMRAAVLIPNSVTIKINNKPTLYPITNGSINVNNTTYKVVNPPDNPTSRQMSSSFSNSSLYNHIPSMLDSPQAWSAASNDNNQWLQLNLDAPTAIAGVITQSRGSGFPGKDDDGKDIGDYSIQMVTQYQVQYWNGTSWIYVDNNKQFEGNSPVDDKIGNLFTNPIITQSIRILPTNAVNHISMRAGLLSLEGEPTLINGVVSVIKK